ncbi:MULTISPECIES: GNAT family N-acetyltransferase [Emticicia]|uniref:GNAT family N-acetyltransferase n=1 Tax=Emticicia TaxID=312278 RepID=UPI0007D8BA9D|nr:MULTISPECIES: GNAT family N-acetyltransferase [Emticicia]
MEVLQASIEHIEYVAPLFDSYRQYYGQDADLEGAKKFLLERIQQNESVIFVALEGSEALGFTQLYPAFSSVSMKRQWILNDLFVKADVQNLGIGKAILLTAQEFVKNLGYKGLLLETTPDNTKAQKLYESLGWKREENFYYYWQA